MVCLWGQPWCWLAYQFPKAVLQMTTDRGNVLTHNSGDGNNLDASLPLKTLRAESFLASSHFGGCSVPWLLAAPLQPLPLSSHGLRPSLYFSVSAALSLRASVTECRENNPARSHLEILNYISNYAFSQIRSHS